MLLGIGTCRQRERRRARFGIHGSDGVAHDRRQMREQAVEAHRRRSVRKLTVVHLVERGFRALGRRHRIALALLLRRRLVGEQQRLQSLAHMPLHVISQHAEEDVRLDATFEAVTDRTHVQVDTFQCAERALDIGQPLVVEHSLLGAHVGFGDAGADHVETIECGLGGDTLVVDGVHERAVLDIEVEVLGDLVSADHLADPHADLGRAFEASTRNAGGAGSPTTLDAGLVERDSRHSIGGRAAQLFLGDDDPTEPNPPTPPAASIVVMAPKGDQALAMVGMDIYTVSVPQVGATAPTVSIANPATAAVPVRKLNDVGGEFPTWSSDGRKVMWSLANALWTYDLDRAKVVEDSLKADAKVKAAAKRDSAATAAKTGTPPTTPPAPPVLTGPDSAAKADSIKKNKPGYKPVEQRVVVNAMRDTPHGTVVLRGGRAITMKGNEIIENADVLVKDNRIVAVGVRGAVTVPSDAKIIDVSGKTVMPGFVDTHYHPQWLTPSIHTNQVWQYLATLAFGTTTTRDPQTATTDFLSYGDRVETGEVVGPRIYTTGPGVFISEQVKDLDHARTILKKYAQYYDTKTLKMYMTGNRQQRQWIIMAAKELGLMPTTEGGLDFKLNITHGLDGYPGIEHTLPITPKFNDVFEWYKGTQVTNSPTLIVEYGGPFGEGWFYQSENLLADPKLMHFTHPVDIDTKIRRRGIGNAPGPAGFALREEYAMWQHAEDVAKTVAAGGRIGVGSHGQLQGLGMHWEIWLLQSGGLSQHDVLRAATIVGAEAIGLASDIGSLEPGKMADIIVLDRDPLVNIRNTNSVSLVMKNGRLFDASTLDEVYPRQRKLPMQQWMTGAPDATAGIKQ